MKTVDCENVSRLSRSLRGGERATLRHFFWSPAKNIKKWRLRHFAPLFFMIFLLCSQKVAQSPKKWRMRHFAPLFWSPAKNLKKWRLRHCAPLFMVISENFNKPLCATFFKKWRKWSKSGACAICALKKSPREKTLKSGAFPPPRGLCGSSLRSECAQ